MINSIVPSFDLTKIPLNPTAVGWYPGEILALRPPPRMKVSEWADERRMLQPGTSRSPGPWSTDTTPYLREIMDAYSEPNIRHIVLCSGTQVGKTESLYNILGFIIDLDPYGTLLVYPREDDAKTISRTRLQPMIEACPSLREKKSAQMDFFQILEMHFPGMALFLVGANSAAALSQKACRNILRDEVDKYPERVGKDADPLSLSEERAKSFWDVRKIVDVSSPTYEARGIWKQLQTCDEIRHYELPCPHCGTYQRLIFAQIRWESVGEGHDRVNHAKNTARYRCEACSEGIGDEHKQSMLLHGRWVTEKECEFEPESIGFQLSSLYSPWLTWGDIAEQFLKANEAKKKGDRRSLQNFINGWLAEPWIEYEQERKEDQILALRDERPRGLVPSEGVLGLTAGADVQDNGFFYTVRAWGRSLESWLIREGFVDEWDVLQGILEGRYQDAEGKEYPIFLAFIDAMGHRTAETYKFCRGKTRIRPSRGEQRMANPYAVTKVDTYPGTKKPIPGGVRLFRLHSNYYKDMLSGKLAVDPADPGAFHLHSDTSGDYARQMIAEYRDDAGIWQCPDGRPNHYWDCEYLALAAADIIALATRKKPDEEGDFSTGRRSRTRRKVLSGGVNL